MDLLWLFVDAVIALAYIAAPWLVIVYGSEAVGIDLPDWLDDGVVGIMLFAGWAVYAIYLARQTTLWLGLGA